MQNLQQAFNQFNRLSAQLNASVDRINQNVERFSPADPDGANVNPRLLDAIPGGVVVLDRHGKVVEANRSARDLLGASLEQQACAILCTRYFCPNSIRAS